MRTTSQLRQMWGPSCAQNLVRVPLGPASLSVHPKCEQAFRALAAVIDHHGYPVKKTATGAYNCRTITNGSGLSLHSFGIAVDINWNDNPYGPTLVTDIPVPVRRDIKKIRTKGGVPVFRWGGDYSRNKDAMHFEVVASPTEVASGLDPRSLVGAAPSDAGRTAPPVGSGLQHSGRMAKVSLDLPVLQRGDKGPAIRGLQHALNALGAGPLKVDGGFGPDTDRSVRTWQAGAGLGVDGVVGRRSWAALVDTLYGS